MSYIRTKYEDADGQLHAFREFEDNDTRLGDLHDTWQRFLATCDCSWPLSDPPERGHFHTPQIADTIDESCEPHRLVSAANNYCVTIDYEWDLIADWYHIGEPRRAGVDGAAMYQGMRARAQREGSNVWPPWGH